MGTQQLHATQSMPTFEQWSYHSGPNANGCDGRTINVHLVSDFC